MLTNDEMIKKMLDDPEVKAEYDTLKPEFARLDELLKARTKEEPSRNQSAART